MKKPNLNQEGQTELDKAGKQIDAFNEQVKDMTQDRMNAAPKQETEPQTKMSTKEAQNADDIYLKPNRTIGSKEKFDEKFRKDYDFAKEYVKFIAENKEIIGEDIELWTKKFPGQPAEFWRIPTNKPVWGPRYLAEQLKSCYYHRLVMKQNVVTEQNSVGQMYGALAADTTINRIDAHPVSDRKSVFMGSSAFR